MVRFEKFLNASKEPEWESYYIAYGDLKTVLRHEEYKQEARIRLQASRGRVLLDHPQHDMEKEMALESSTPLASTASLEDSFSQLLDREVEKVDIFFLKAQGGIANKLLKFRLRMRALGPVDDQAEDNLQNQILDSTSSTNTLSGCAIGALSATSPTKSRRRRLMLAYICLFQDDLLDVKPSSPIVAFLSPPHRTARPSDLIEEYRDICHQLTRLLHFLELNADAVRKILKKHDRRLLSDDLTTGSYLTTRVSRNPDSHLRQLFWQNGLNAIVLSLKAAIQEMPAKCQMLQDGSAIHPQDKKAIKDMVASLDSVQTARAQVRRKTTPFTHFLSLKPLIFDQEELEVGDIHDLLPMVPHGLSVWLNIAQIFLSTVNAYITVPTTNKYAENLGVHAAYSGVIIGMSPLAQIFSAFLFSYWSNYAFKLPLVVSSLLQLSGNVLYGAALGYKSLPMLLLGRFLGGAGTAEAVNRRYIADVIPPSERTGASVAFVTASALGMSAGPALAAVLFPIDFQVGRFPIINSTAPAWLMVILWAVFLVIMAVCFREPTHRHRNAKSELLHNHKTGKKDITPESFATPAQMDEERVLCENERSHLISHDSKVDYGGLCVASASVEEQVGPKDPPTYFMSPSSTATSALSIFHDRELRPSSYLPKLRHPLAKIHPILVLVWRNKPLMLTLAVYFLIEIADEIILSSAGLIATSYFNWSISHVGAFMAALGLLVLPANYLVGEFSEHGYEDRTIIVTSQAITIMGLLLIISYWGEYNEFQFVAGTSLIFVAVAVMEGVDTSLMSKVIPPVLSRGTFNSGLLAVQIGMVAKALGDGLITVIGLSADDLINGLYIPILVITVGLFFICKQYFKHMS